MRYRGPLLALILVVAVLVAFLARFEVEDLESFLVPMKWFVALVPPVLILALAFGLVRDRYRSRHCKSEPDVDSAS